LSDIDAFQRECESNAQAMSGDADLRRLSREWIDLSGRYRYAYNWRWCGLPIIQLPPDIVVVQEIVWKVRPTLIIETGVARGGSLVFNASLLAMLDAAEGSGVTPQTSRRRVVGVDIEIRSHNRAAIEQHPFSPMIDLVEGSSVNAAVVSRVREKVREQDVVLVVLDSNHTHEHVLAELEAYASMVTKGSYCVVQDTGIEDAPAEAFANRPFGRGNSPRTAVDVFLRQNPQFVCDTAIDAKTLITSSPGGYLRRQA